MDARTTELTIGRVARGAGLTIDTVRYYEREGLLQRPGRTAAGYRQYTEEAVARLRFIREAKKLGFTLSEIRELLALKVAPGKSCADVRARAEAKIIDVRQRIDQLNRIRRALMKLTAACSGRGPTSECPILESLESAKKSQ